MSTKLVLNTGNPGKLREFKAHFSANLNKEVEFFQQEIEVDENGQSFEANAIIKATALAGNVKESSERVLLLGEDSGLSVPELGNLPGIYSARFCTFGVSEDNQLIPNGKSKPEDADKKNNAQLIEILSSRKLFEKHPEGVPAKYMLALAVADLSGEVLKVFHGTCPVKIVTESIEENGFGYDHIAKHDEIGHLGLATKSEKAKVSHRAEAISKLLRWL